MRNVWKIGSRWDDHGAAGTSIYDEVFFKYGIVFAHTNNCLKVKDGDLLAISDGYPIVAIAIALCSGRPIGELGIPNISLEDKKYFDDDCCIGCRVQIIPLSHNDIFQHQKADRFCNAPAIRERINALYAKYASRENNFSRKYRICRLTWNSEGWRVPSGPTGKSQADKTYEKEHGFGHEEWLFDLDKIIDGYHYGFLEPVNRQYGSYKGQHYDVWLYTIDGESKKRYCVGKIEDIHVLTEDEAMNCLEQYQKNGWIDEMKAQLARHGLKFGDFSEYEQNPTLLFNVKFCPSNLMCNDPLLELPADHPVQELSRYNFAHFKEEFRISTKVEKSFCFQPSSDIDNAKPKLRREEYERLSKTYEIIYLHKIISERLTKRLRKEFGNENVTPEHGAANGGLIDILVNDDDGFIFYEIKTFPEIKKSIREALGQLIEYTQWPGVKYEKAIKQLIIVSQSIQGIEDVKKYLEYIRNNFHIPIYYQAYDFEADELSELY